jgi:hypothetical protein
MPMSLVIRYFRKQEENAAKKIAENNKLQKKQTKISTEAHRWGKGGQLCKNNNVNENNPTINVELMTMIPAQSIQERTIHGENVVPTNMANTIIFSKSLVMKIKRLTKKLLMPRWRKKMMKTLKL